jgi:Flp pilus assembly protein TadG
MKDRPQLLNALPRRLAPVIDTALRDTRGVSALEFAIMATIYSVVLAGVVNVSGAIYTRFQLETAIASAQSYVLTQTGSVNAASAASLGDTLARMTHHAAGSIRPEADIDVNDGAEDQDAEDTTASGEDDTVTATGTAAQADSCYCPTVAGNAVTWGTSKTCGSTCLGGGVAGKYVFTKAVATYTPLIPIAGVTSSSTVTCSSLTRVK